MPYLLLEDNTSFKGYWMSAPREAVGEVVVHTGMTGYQETLTDPASYGQIIIMSYPLIGNYGVAPLVSESTRIHARGMIMQEACDEPSHWQARGTLSGYLDQEGCAGLYGLDTRAVVRHLREKGVMRGIISETCDEAALAKARAFAMGDAVKMVTCADKYEIPGNGWHVAVLDVGLRRSTLDALYRHGCRITVFPADAPVETMLKDDPDGIMVAGGPGDPSKRAAIVESVERLLGTRPMLGIGAGHLYMALAVGGKTRRMSFGHCGSSLPVMKAGSLQGMMTAQNHDYEIIADSLPPEADILYTNGQDGSVEGIALREKMALGVAFEPPATTGQRGDCAYEQLTAMMAQYRRTT